MSRTDPVAPPPAGGAPQSSRKPYPWHLLLQVGGQPPQGLMLRDGIVGRRVLPMTNFQAPVQEEQTSDIYRERSYSWRKMSLGYGDFTQQSNGAPARYFYASNAWHAGAMRGLGPRLRQLTPGRGRGRGGRLRGGRPRHRGHPRHPPLRRRRALRAALGGAHRGRAGAVPRPRRRDRGALLDALDGRGPRAAGRAVPHRQPQPHRPPVALPGRGLDRPHRRRGAPRRLRAGHGARAVAGLRHRRPAGRPLRRQQVRGQPQRPGQLDGAHRGGGRLRAGDRAVRAADAPVRPQGGRHGVGPAGGHRHRDGAEPDPRPPGEPRPGERQAPRGLAGRPLLPGRGHPVALHGARRPSASAPSAWWTTPPPCGAPWAPSPASGPGTAWAPSTTPPPRPATSSSTATGCRARRPPPPAGPTSSSPPGTARCATCQGGG